MINEAIKVIERGNIESIKGKATATEIDDVVIISLPDEMLKDNKNQVQAIVSMLRENITAEFVLIVPESAKICVVKSKEETE